MKRVTNTQLKTGGAPYATYLAKRGNPESEWNQFNCVVKSKPLTAGNFVELACNPTAHQS
ncbi:hypothetical protein NCCP2716_19070 [Sporosarcina sp. NCCP-2716]|nr:hypothetical protein NCCP2716_19070 [Sporosarcina sp. NCCP-2716]